MNANNRTRVNSTTSTTANTKVNNDAARETILATMTTAVSTLVALGYIVAVLGVLSVVYRVSKPLAATVARFPETSYSANWYNAETASVIIGLLFTLSILAIHTVANNDNYTDPLEMAASIGVLSAFLLGGWLGQGIFNIEYSAQVLKMTGMNSLGVTLASAASLWFVLDIMTDFKKKIVKE